ncbi:hypothetical protein [uncultured Methanobrevibacter sp.]|nr:hypothetical protein [uncultured Methanobrevibacter sp.]
MDLNDIVFDYYCFVEHEDFMTVEERKVSSIFGESLLFLQMINWSKI